MDQRAKIVQRRTWLQAGCVAGTAMAFLALGVGCAHLPSQPVWVVFETGLGNITVEVDVAHAPITGANFLKYVDGKFYDGGISNRTPEQTASTRRRPSTRPSRLCGPIGSSCRL
jgi:hypothetical protein